MGIGRKNLIEKWIEYYSIYDYNDSYHDFKDLCKINPDMTIDVVGNISLNSCGLYKFPNYIRFNIIHGDMMINHNNFKNMIGCPVEVKGSFFVNGNPLESLDGIPKIIRETLIISSNCGFTTHYIQNFTKVTNVRYTHESMEKILRDKEDWYLKIRPGKLEDYVFDI